jgi:uncharacterized protein YjbI with pentapeptide repeats/uncharacterized RDD family membrane protein YckC
MPLSEKCDQMVIPIQRNGTDPSITNENDAQAPNTNGTALKRSLSLSLRRCGAWVVEVSLIVTSSVVPFSIGLYAQSYDSRSPLNPLLQTTYKAIAPTLALPARHNQKVTPATNVLWTVALFAPLALASWQLYRLGKTGQTLPKRWFGVKVVTILGAPPGLARVLLREAVGRWGLPVSVAFLIWRFVGGYPSFSVMAVLSGFMVLGAGAIALFSPSRRTLHDRLAKTRVLDAHKTTPIPTIGFPPAPPRWLNQTNGNGIHLTQPHPTPNSRLESDPNFYSQASRKRVKDTTKWQRLRQFWVQNSIPAWLTVSFASLVGLWGSYVGLQIYTQTQVHQRELEQQKNQVFIALVQQLSATTTAAPEERQAAILALAAAGDDPRVVRLMGDLLTQEKNPTAIAAIEQVFVRIGTVGLPELQRLNQSLSQQLEKERYDVDPQEYRLVQQRLAVTKVAIANILTLDSNHLHNIDLSRTNLSQSTDIQALFALVLDNMDLSGVNFQAASLTGASFEGTRFWGAGNDGHLGTFDDSFADLSGADLKEANLTGAVLNNVSMENTNLIHGILNQANLSQASLTGAKLSSAKLIGASLRQATLEKASLTGADLTEADLTQANLHGALLGRVSAVGTKLESADLRVSDWRGADLSGANLSRAKLQNANLSDTRLAGTNFHKAELQGASFRNANLSMADLQGANVAGADFQGAIFAVTRALPPDQFIQTQPDISISARVKGVDFTTAKNLDQRQLAYICAQGGRHPRCP